MKAGIFAGKGDDSKGEFSVCRICGSSDVKSILGKNGAGLGRRDRIVRDVFGVNQDV